MTMEINGPFLLSPQDKKLTVAWEGVEKQEFKLFYGAVSSELREAVVTAREYIQEPQRDNVYLYYAVLEGLELKHDYIYRLVSGETSVEGKFTYFQSEDKEHLKIITLSDSHAFETAEDFLKTVAREKPDFIIHSGDISCSTGLQKREYTTNWFGLIPEILRTVPVYYIPGNHDSGCVFDEIFMVPQRLYTKNCLLGNSYAFKQGEYHFTIVDSNPWGLYEMNADNSRAVLDENSQKLIDSTIEWLEEELSSEEAQQSKWRILICHHPYTDEYTNKYIAPLAEKYDVNLLLSGHVHYYTKAVSPESKTVYISQGNAEVGRAYLAPFKGERFLEEFPQVVNVGGNDYGILKLSPTELDYLLYGYKDHKDVLVDTVKMGKEVKACEVRNLEYRKLDEFGYLEISGELYNPNDYNILAALEIIDNGQRKTIYNFGKAAKSQEIYLAPGESRNFKVNYTLDKPGKHHLVLGEENIYLDILEREEISFRNFRVSQKNVNDNAYITAKMEIINNLDREVFSFIPYYINGKVVETRNVSLKPMEQCSLEFIYKVRRNGKYTVTIGNGLQKEITVAGSIRLIPMALDKSGKGNHGLIHGNPRLIKEDDKVFLCLDEDGDYVEVPKSKSLIAPEGFTAEVKAEVQRLAYEHEMGHNPLMVRGKSVGWGATYLFRMVADRAGAMRWGICHDITEIPFIGGSIQIQKMGDYVLSFDKKKGGQGYINDELVARIPGIGAKESLRQWEEEPIFIGYSYIGHIIPEIDRPKYYTHLKAKINEAKFFTKAVGLDKLNKNKKDLALWFDFKNILTCGSYETNWRHPVPNLRDKGECKVWKYLQLAVKSKIDPTAGINLKIQVSDNKIYVKDELEINLRDGDNYLDLTPLAEGKYIRIICHLNGHLGEQGASVAEIFEFGKQASDGKYTREFFWSTNADWQQGKFKGAVAIPPVDRLKDFPEYTDIIHG